MNTGHIISFAGKYLSDDTFKTISAQDLQKYMKDDPGVGYNIPLEECRMALGCLETGGFLELVSNHATNPIYCYPGGKPVKKVMETQFDKSISTLPLYSPAI